MSVLFLDLQALSQMNLTQNQSFVSEPAEYMRVSDLLSMKGGDEAFTVFAVASTSQTTFI